MTAGHIALIVIGIVGTAESTWGMSAPDRLKASVRDVVKEAPERNPWLGLFFVGLAGILWTLMSPGKQVSDWALLILCWIFAGGALVNFKQHGFRDLVDFLILRRSARHIRIFYACEFCLSCVLIGIGVLGY
jgi:hypothetical protein